MDPATLDLNTAKVKIFLVLDSDRLYEEYVNTTDAVNNTVSREIVLDAIKRLKIESASVDPYVVVGVQSGSDSNELDNAIIGARLDIYDTKKVDGNLISNSMLAIGGFVMMLGAFAATPWWNPTRHDSRTRRVFSKIRRKRG